MDLDQLAKKYGLDMEELRARHAEPLATKRTQRRTSTRLPHVRTLIKTTADARSSPATQNRLVDIMGKRMRTLLPRLGKGMDDVAIRAKILSTSQFQANKLLKQEADLFATEYSAVVDEIACLLDEEQVQKAERGRKSKRSFIDNPAALHTLIQGLKEASEACHFGTSLDVALLRKSTGEQLVSMGEFWLARLLFQSCFPFLQLIDDEHDRLRCELWLLIAYICILHNDDENDNSATSSEIGYDLPTACLHRAREVGEGKLWYTQRAVFKVRVPKPIAVAGLRADSIQIKTNWSNFRTVATNLLYVLSVKKARYWEEQLNKTADLSSEAERQKLKDNVVDELTAALAYADSVRQYPAFMATTLKRGLFFDKEDDMDKALDDYEALRLLSISFDDREALGVVYNRIGKAYECEGGKLVEAMDYYAREWEVALESNLEEVKADSLKDIGAVLLAEGDSWEADECETISHSLFQRTRKVDTPNDFDELSWALCGLARGHHLWGRWAALGRTPTAKNVDGMLRWKSYRYPLPPAFLKKFDFWSLVDMQKQYAGAPGGKGRRLFEFEEELKRRKQEQESSYDRISTREVFEYINASDKERSTYHPGDGDPNYFLQEDSESEEDSSEEEEAEEGEERRIKRSRKSLAAFMTNVAKVRAESKNLDGPSKTVWFSQGTSAPKKQHHHGKKPRGEVSRSFTHVHPKWSIFASDSMPFAVKVEAVLDNLSLKDLKGAPAGGRSLSPHTESEFGDDEQEEGDEEEEVDDENLMVGTEVEHMSKPPSEFLKELKEFKSDPSMIKF